MPEILENPVASPASTPENLPKPSTPAENDESGRTADPAKTGLAAKVRSAATRVFGQAGFGFTKGRGRPKKCTDCSGLGCESCKWTGKMPGKLDRPDPVEGTELAATAAKPDPAALPGSAPAVADSGIGELFRRSVIASVKGALGILKAIVATYASAAGIDEAFTAKTLAKAEPDPGAMDDFTESLDVVLKKHNIQPTNAEEWALAFNTGRIVAPYFMLIAEFKGEIRRQRRDRQDHYDREREKEQLRREQAAGVES